MDWPLTPSGRAVEKGKPVKALTVCQPYAHLICLPDDDKRAKRVENRTWETSYRGPLLIHSGKNRNWLSLDAQKDRDIGYDIPLTDMAFGAVVGVCRLADCFKLEVHFKAGLQTGRTIPQSTLRNHSWLAGHQHVEGPWCFVLTQCRRFAEPIPYRGAQGLFDIPQEVVAAALEAIAVTP